tara:strand:+ start:130 stop:465 length:336 start_codon:yes stop_codon:yes gene_type:complete
MASNFKNASYTFQNANTDQTIYTVDGLNQHTAVVHSMFFANKHDTSNCAVTLKINDWSTGSARVILNKVPVPPNTTLSLDKTLNLELNDSIIVQSDRVECDVVSSILELTT